MDISIIYEDKTFIVINKPSGIVVNRASSVRGETIQAWMEERLRTKNLELITNNVGDFYQRAGIVHRLDKDTSGLLIIAKTAEAFYHLQFQFKERKITKKYQALVHGRVLPPKGEIKASVGRLPWNRERFGILPGGRPAITLYNVLSPYKKDKQFFSLLEVGPKTGRTHQIRVHLKYIGHPIVTDKFYAGRKTYKQDIKFCPRLFLHAFYLKLKHPETLEQIEFESKLPKDLKRVLGKLQIEL